jgi:hypothetical protein
MSPFGGAQAAAKGKVVGKETLLGKPCEIRSVGAGGQEGKVKVWLWKSLPLKLVASGQQGGGLTMIATKVESPVSLPSSLFRLPSGYQVKDFQPTTGMPGGK